VRRICLIVNPSAGGGRAAQRLPAVEAALRAHGLPFRVERTTSMEHARALSRETLETGEVAVAMGGDGLTGAVAGELCNSAGVLGVVPGGRGNDFARKLGIPSNPASACAVLAGGAERAVDAAEIRGRVYLGIASAGIDSDCQDIANATRLPLGTFVYVYGTLRALATWTPAEWEVTVDGERHAFRGYSVAVANTGVFGGGMRLVPDASVTDGELDVVFSGDLPKRRYLRNIQRVFDGSHVHEPEYRVVRGREVTFQADRTFTVYADGDPISDLPATVRILAGSLRVLAPETL
jgi:YegS/Rv2252/BmrU family lipid kinase